MKGLARDWETAKNYIRPRLYNKAINAEVSRSAEPYGFDDLVIVPCLEMVIKDGIATVKLTKELLWSWGITEEDAFKAAEANLPEYIIIDINEYVGISGGVKMYAVTTPTSAFGAYGIIPMRKEIEKLFPNGYMVVPSSVHEVICTEKQEAEKTAEIIGCVNGELVDPREQLGTHPYYF